MSISEAENFIQPRKQIKIDKTTKKKTGIYSFAVFTLFAIVAFLCINNYKVIQSYRELTNQLMTAYKTIDDYSKVKVNLNESNNELENEKYALAEEIRSIREEFEKTSRGSEDIARQLDEVKKQMNELKKKNKELVDDNIALQNSLKMAAAVGIKPQKFTLSPKLDTRNNIVKGKYVGKFLGTAYTPSKEECGNNKGITKSGEPIIPGVTVAIDSKYWSFGTVFYIKGLGYAVAMDTGSGVKGKYRFDFSVLNRDFAKQLGTRKWDVYLVKLGDGDIDKLDL
jgi:Uncharacterized protein conserved in bacteria